MSLYWRRLTPGRYVSVGLTPGYEVGKTASGEWYFEGHGLDGIADTKSQAQAACEANVKPRETA